jgi:poly(A) polymerase Pap1
MKVFLARSHVYGCYGYCKELDCLVVAETKNVARSIVLTEYPEFPTESWSIEEVDITENKCIPVHFYET